MSGEPEDPSSAATLMYNSLEPNLNLVSQVAESAGVAADRSLVVGERVWRVVFSARPGSIYGVDRLVPNLVLASGIVIGLFMGLLAVIGLRSRQPIRQSQRARRRAARAGRQSARRNPVHRRTPHPSRQPADGRTL